MDEAKYFKIPYKKHGRGWDGADCYGFIRIVLLEEKGLNLPLLDGKDEVDSEVASFFTPSSTPEDFSVVFLSGGPFHQAHSGIYYQGAIFHMTNYGVSTISLKRAERYIKGFYNPKI